MRVEATTLALTVANPRASSDFLVAHFGFREDLAFEGGASLSHPGGGPSMFFLQEGLEALAGTEGHELVQGLIVALTVSDLDAEHARLLLEGVVPAAPIREDSWGERSLQVVDPNGVVLQLVGWAGERPY